MSDLILPAAMENTYKNFKFAPARRHDGKVYCSGQIGTDANGKVPEQPEEEFRNAFNLVGIILEEAGLDFSNIIEMTTYHVGLQENMGKFMKVKDEFLNEPYPAWTAIGISELAVPGARVEIRVVGG